MNTAVPNMQFPGLRVRISRNALLAAMALALGLPRGASADTLWEWNDAALAATVAARQPPFLATRTMAILDVAMFDATNAVERRYEPCAMGKTPDPGASAEAAAASAGHAVLTALFPDQVGAWDQLLGSSLERIADPAARDAGVAIGEHAAAAVLALRTGDGAERPATYRPSTRPGRWVPTTLPVGSTWMEVRPWTLASGDQFRPPPPPAIGSARWKRDCDEVRALGGKTSTSRTAAQTEAARFWAMTGPAAQWPVARALTSAPGRTLVQNAHVLARMAMAVADAYVAVFDAKYAYLFWRPITAVRNGGGRRGPLPAETSWEPLVETPMHPEYPCAHCITSAAAAAVLEAEFGTGELAPPIEMTSTTAPGVKRGWTTIRAWQEEVSSARVWGGIHYRSSTEVGTAMGRKIGEWAVRKELRPAAGRISREP